MHTAPHAVERLLEPRRLLPRRQSLFPYAEAAETEIPRMAALAVQLQHNMTEYQPMPDAAMDGLNDAHTAVVEALAAEPVTRSSEVAEKLRVLADLVEGDEGGVLNLESIMLQAVMHDLGALRIREVVADGFDVVETIYGDLLRLRAGEYGRIDRSI